MEITEALETIINARYGREVRQAIHDGIKQAYEDAIKNGNANMEVSQARGSYPTLAERLIADFNKLNSDKISKGKVEASDLMQSVLDIIDKKIAKGNVTMADLTQEVREALTGGAVPIVGDGSIYYSSMTGVDGSLGNLYDKTKHFVANMYVRTDGTGTEINATDWGLAKIPVVAGKTYSLLNSDGNYSGDIGAIGFLKNEFYGGGALIGTQIYRANPSGTYNGVPYITFKAPSEAVYVIVTVKKAAGFDYSNDLVLVEGDVIDDLAINGFLSKLFNVQLVDSEARTLLDQLFNKKELEGKKIEIFGDSLSDPEAPQSTAKYYNLADNLLGTVTNCHAKSGSGYKRQEELSRSIPYQVDLASSNADMYVFFGSFNDARPDLFEYGSASDRGTETLASAINEAFDKLEVKNPLAKVVVMSPTPWEESEIGNASHRHTQYVDLLKSIALNHGYEFIDLYRTIGLKPWLQAVKDILYSTDNGGGTHFNNLGHSDYLYPIYRDALLKRLK